MAKTLDKPSLYETDYVAWLEEQAAHLRAGRLAALDVENVAEELEGLARSDRHELAEPPRDPDPPSAEMGPSAGPARPIAGVPRGGADAAGSGDCWTTARSLRPVAGRWRRERSTRRRSSRRRSRPQLSETAFPGNATLFPRADLRARAAGGRAARATVPKEAPMTPHQTLTVRLHPDDNVVTARIDLLAKTAVGGEQVTCAARIPAGHKVATRPHRGRRADQEIQPDHRLRDRGDRARRSTSTPTMSRCATSPATTRSAPMRGRPPMCPKTGARASRAFFATTARRARATSSACCRP